MTSSAAELLLPQCWGHKRLSILFTCDLSSKVKKQYLPCLDYWVSNHLPNCHCREYLQPWSMAEHSLTGVRKVCFTYVWDIFWHDGSQSLLKVCLFHRTTEYKRLYSGSVPSQYKDSRRCREHYIKQICCNMHFSLGDDKPKMKRGNHELKCKR